MVNKILLEWYVVPFIFLQTLDAKVCDASNRVQCIKVTGGVQMPLVALGTGASSYLHQCNEPKPNPPFRNVSCFKKSAFESAKVWLTLGGSMVEMAQVDRNMIPVGEALDATGTKRDDVFLETKCWGAQGFSATIECAADSLQMLGTDYIDLLILHHPFMPTPGCWGSPVWDQPCNGQPLYDPGATVRQDSWRALEVLVQSKKVRAIGLSDFSDTQINEVLQIANITPAVLQTHWAPTAHNDTLLAFCRQHGITIQAWGAVSAGQWGKSVLSNPALVKIALAHSTAAKNVSTAQVALKWSLQQGIAVVAGTGDPAHMASDMDLFHFNLTDAEMQEISLLKGDSATEVKEKEGLLLV
eukprot:gnl/MRDRNA2_/MRDRNA2_14294_c0_seq1.p1 gnl/MRDRNA2_/MRDRNA2_14294_c0~~gnl/MRDRNA2_/MRDRNA2_14294_c0_seq1.p1  ORF type:complete len:356 (+),score=77.90 gnl/MRDRNA2_/MRDRNA2_14294_c0_seq1:85-1152(+)